MKKHFFYNLVLLQVFVVGTTMAQYQSKTIKVKNSDYEGTIEVCTNCKITADPQKTYKWFKDGKINESKGAFQGELLHGKVELYTIGLGGEKEMIERGNYFTGLKDGRIEDYAFGNLEHAETYEKGELKAIEYYQPEKKEVDRKIVYLSPANTEPRRVLMSFYYSNNHLDDKKQPTGKKYGRRLEVEGYQVKNGENVSNFYDGAYKKYTIWEDVETLRQQGNFSKNRRHGEWKTYYEDGVVAIAKYENDMLVSEQFLKNGQPFTGIAKAFDINPKREIQTVEVKNGLREGKTSDNFRENDKKERVANRHIEYVAGKMKNADEDYAAFLKSHKIIKEAQYTQECDSKGSGLIFLDKIIYTDKGAFVHFQTVNTTFIGGAAISTAAPGKDDAFTAYDLTNKKTYKVTKVFNLALQPNNQPAAYGEMSTFMLYFEGLTQAVKKISFIEGDPENPFVIDEKTGNTTYNWGCYELTTK